MITFFLNNSGFSIWIPGVTGTANSNLIPNLEKEHPKQKTAIEKTKE